MIYLVASVPPHLSLGVVSLVAGLAVTAAGLFVWLIKREDDREYHKGDDE